MTPPNRETMRKHRVFAMLDTVAIDESGAVAFAVAWCPNQADLPGISVEATEAVNRVEKARVTEPAEAVPFTPAEGRKLLSHLITYAPTPAHLDYYKTLRRLLKNGGYLVYAQAPITPDNGKGV